MRCRFLVSLLVGGKIYGRNKVLIGCKLLVYLQSLHRWTQITILRPREDSCLNISFRNPGLSMFESDYKPFAMHHVNIVVISFVASIFLMPLQNPQSLSIVPIELCTGRSNPRPLCQNHIIEAPQACSLLLFSFIRPSTPPVGTWKTQGSISSQAIAVCRFVVGTPSWKRSASGGLAVVSTQCIRLQNLIQRRNYLLSFHPLRRLQQSQMR